jgi:peroxiredoxin
VSIRHDNDERAARDGNALRSTVPIYHSAKITSRARSFCSTVDEQPLRTAAEQTMKAKLLVALLACLATTSCKDAPVAESPAEGAMAPEISVTDSNGKTHTVSQYRGKTVVLEWFNHGCPFVKKHYESGNMQKLQEEFTGKGVVWLTINSSARFKQGHLTPEKANARITEWKMKSSALLLDPDGKAGQTYGARTTPHMFVINPDGKVIYQGAIDSKASTKPEDIPSSTNYVKVALDEAVAGKPVTTAKTKPYGCSVKY